MKFTKTLLIRSNIRGLAGLALALAITTFSARVAKAVPYASCITNSGGTVSFLLNQNAQDVKVIYDGGGVGNTNLMGARTRGSHSFSMSGHTTYRIMVTHSDPVAWVKFSDETNYNILRYFSPRGVAVNRSTTNLTAFGRIYVANATGGTAGATTVPTGNPRVTGRGMYIVNPDWSDPFGQGTGVRNASMTFDSSGLANRGANSPWRINTSQDGKVYISDYSTNTGTIYRADPDLATSELVLAGLGAFDNNTVHTTVGSITVLGTSTDANLQVYAISGWTPFFNKVLRYDINGGTLPWNTAPVVLGCPGICTVNNVTSDSDIAPSGRLYTCENRSAGTDADSIRVFDTDGTTLLWGSLAQLGSPDPLRLSRSVKVSPDGKLLVINTDNNALRFLPLDSSGIPVFANMTTVSGTTAFGGTGTIGRDAAFDAVGNVYAISSGLEKMVILSPGGFTIAITSFDGTSGSFQLIKPSTDVSVTATTPITSQDTSQPPGVFTISRVGDTVPALPVGYTLTGTATNGTHYTLLSGTATIPASASSVDVNVVAIPTTPAGPTRTVIMTLNSSNTYAVVPPANATVLIEDTNTPAASVAALDAQMYERTNDYARFRITRLGLTNVDITVNVTYAGSATENTHFYGPATITVPAGTVNTNLYVLPIHNGVVTGPLTVHATVAAAGDGSYTIGTPGTSGDITIVDSDLLPETALWRDNFDTSDSATNYQVYFATTAGAPDDYTIVFGYDYSPITGGTPAPHSPGGDTLGVYMTVNKNEPTVAAAALNAYVTNHNFSGNYALRFDMFLIQNDTVGQSEYNLFGINHDGMHTNWFRNNAGGVPAGWNFDGLFFSVESDGAALGDYVGYSSPTTAGNNPTSLNLGRNASTLTGVFKSPPWTFGGSGGGAAATVFGTTTPIWADVELSQINNVIRWKINNTLIFAYTNTTPYTSGQIMVGYCDAFDSVGSSGGAVIYDNLRVISLTGPLITSITTGGGNVTIDFTGSSGDSINNFVLQAASAVNGPYADVSSTITSLGGASFRAVRALNGNAQFYRIRRLY